MGHGLLSAIAPDREIADCQAPAEFQQPALAQQIDGVGLAHEVDVEIGRNGVRHRAQPAKQQQIEAEIGHRHQGRASDGAARAKVASRLIGIPPSR